MYKKNGSEVGEAVHAFTSEAEQKFAFHSISFWFQKVHISKVRCVLTIMMLFEFLKTTVSVLLLETYVG